MSFRVGNQGRKMWPHCLRLGVAAITYHPLTEVDLSKCHPGEPKELWAQLEPAQKASLRRVAYEMKAGDVIYVKEGPKIISRGVVKGSYRFDSKFCLKDPNGVPWAHQVPVDWSRDFPEINILLGSEPLTVKELSRDHVRKLQSAIKQIDLSNRQMEAAEGKTYRTEAVFRRRNRTLIQAKKANSDYRCEVCGFSFEGIYGEIGREFIIAHHLRPISSGVAKTTLDDIALLCANCHAMVHVQNPPMSLGELRNWMARLRKPKASK